MLENLRHLEQIKRDEAAAKAGEDSSDISSDEHLEKINRRASTVETDDGSIHNDADGSIHNDADGNIHNDADGNIHNNTHAATRDRLDQCVATTRVDEIKAQVAAVGTEYASKDASGISSDFTNTDEGMLAATQPQHLAHPSVHTTDRRPSAKTVEQILPYLGPYLKKKVASQRMALGSATVEDLQAATKLKARKLQNERQRKEQEARFWSSADF